MKNIDRLTQLNVEIEGLLHVLAKRDNSDIRQLLGDKFSEFTSLFNDLLSGTEASEATIEKTAEDVAETLTQDEVKNQEAVTGEVLDEDDAATEAIERGEARHPFVTPSDLYVTMYTPIEEPFEDIQQDPEALNSTEGEPKAQESQVESVEETTSEDETSASASEDVAEEPKAEEPKAEGPKAEDDAPTPITSDIRVDEMLSRRGATDLKRVFTINDKFRFRRELFNQNDEAFAKALDDLSGLESFAQANEYVSTILGLSTDNPAVEDFLNIIKPHYHQ